MTYSSQHFFESQQWSIYNSEQHSGLEALVYEDTFIRWLPNKYQDCGLIHFYPLYQPTILLGAKDTRLPETTNAYQFLQNKGYKPILRPHGGLAVVCDSQVLNVSIVHNLNTHPTSIDEAYYNMVYLVQQLGNQLQLTVEAYEIPDSYCPGKFDLVCQNKKIGGIAQRRFKNGVTTAAYIGIGGQQTQRGELIREFYEIGKADTTYPTVNPSSMTTLNDLTEQEHTISSIQTLITQIVAQHSVVTNDHIMDDSFHTIYTKQYTSLVNKQPHSLL